MEVRRRRRLAGGSPPGWPTTPESHNATISANPLDDYEFTVTGTFNKPLPRQVDEYLRIERAERSRKVKVGKEEWKVKLPLLNRKHEYWAPRNVTYTFTNFHRAVGE